MVIEESDEFDVFRKWQCPQYPERGDGLVNWRSLCARLRGSQGGRAPRGSPGRKAAPPGLYASISVAVQI